jgi:hypothetical protein
MMTSIIQAHLAFVCLGGGAHVIHGECGQREHGGIVNKHINV